MRYENFAENEYYHIFGKGVNSEKIFLDDKDRARFIFLLTHLQSPVQIHNISWYANSFVKKGAFNIGEEKIDKIIKKRNVELVSFALMPNHFHILVRNLKDSITSVYMHRILTSYGKYFNTKYNKKGHVFDGPFGAVHVENNTQLLHLSAYIHKNPKSIAEWKDNYEKYPWSSYQDYIGLNRWGNFLSTDIILKQFTDQTRYKNFVLESLAKES
jgi:putative transposase